MKILHGGERELLLQDHWENVAYQDISHPPVTIQ
jgi:hypothetical protein